MEQTPKEYKERWGRERRRRRALHSDFLPKYDLLVLSSSSRTCFIITYRQQKYAPGPSPVSPKTYGKRDIKTSSSCGQDSRNRERSGECFRVGRGMDICSPLAKIIWSERKRNIEREREKASWSLGRPELDCNWRNFLLSPSFLLSFLWCRVCSVAAECTRRGPRCCFVTRPTPMLWAARGGSGSATALREAVLRNPESNCSLDRQHSDGLADVSSTVLFLRNIDF